VLFVCLGNICRSPVAEGVFRDRLRRRGLEDFVQVSSAGLGGWHAGERPDARALAVAAKHGVPLASRARRIDPAEFEQTHWIVCMDHQNRRGLEQISAPSERVRLLKSFVPSGLGSSDEVDDPYEHGPEAFDRMFSEIAASIDHFIDHLVRTHGFDDAASVARAGRGATPARTGRSTPGDRSNSGDRRTPGDRRSDHGA